MDFILECPERIPRDVILQLPNGHETHVKFKKTEQTLSHMTEFIRDCKGLLGSALIFSFKGNGRFVVNCLGNDLNEVIYFVNRNIPRPQFDQGNLSNLIYVISINLDLHF